MQQASTKQCDHHPPGLAALIAAPFQARLVFRLGSIDCACAVSYARSHTESAQKPPRIPLKSTPTKAPRAGADHPELATNVYPRGIQWSFEPFSAHSRAEKAPAETEYANETTNRLSDRGGCWRLSSPKCDEARRCERETDRGGHRHDCERYGQCADHQHRLTDRESQTTAWECPWPRSLQPVC